MFTHIFYGSHWGMEKVIQIIQNCIGKYVYIIKRNRQKHYYQKQYIRCLYHRVMAREKHHQ